MMYAQGDHSAFQGVHCGIHIELSYNRSVQNHPSFVRSQVSFIQDFPDPIWLNCFFDCALLLSKEVRKSGTAFH